ncbi:MULTISPECIES: hypothetical protein [unclassified Crossiella]|uniref:hypothetical protein n=1 Tax=unclassified Crossiella TaxID=2620835 RepID=UPI001FFEEC50|nr:MULTISPECIES: hypothetical protein [unclassified Crossiella]MCK2245425.1 hypothetical protein [Crossiella sp. S99.2]MCK2259077.1 hypothetical protein [Crossiella sp. S99.1]
MNVGFGVPLRDESVVVGGACLSYCDADLARLRMDFVADTLMPLLLSAWTGARCLLYLPVGEEIIVSGDTIEPDRWRILGDQLEVFIDALAACVPGKVRPILVRTDDSAVSDAVDDAADEVAHYVDDRQLGSLYTFRRSTQVRNEPGIQRLRQYRRSISSYLPRLIRLFVGDKSVRHVVVAENLHQVKAVSATRSMMESRADTLDHLAHVPPPSVSGTNRMARAAEHSALFCLEDADTQRAKTARMTPHVRRYWENVWPRREFSDSPLTEADTTARMFGLCRTLLQQASSIASRTPVVGGHSPMPGTFDTPGLVNVTKVHDGAD